MLAVMTLLAGGVTRGFGTSGRGMGIWTIGLALMAAGAIATVVNTGSLMFWRVALSNLLYVPGISLLACGLLVFFGRRLSVAGWVAGTTGVYAAGLLLSLSPDQVPYRISVFMLHQLTLAGIGLWLSWRFGGRDIGTLSLRLSMALLATVASVRLWLAVSGTGSVRLMADSPWIWAVMAGLILSLVLGTLALILIAGDRVRTRLEELAGTDALTGLLTRRRFVEQAAQTLATARRQRWNVAFVIIDIDHFKGVNDRFGHQAGDEVLLHMAGLLRRQCREIDLISRFGGEEFVVLLPNTNAGQARHVAERLRTATETSRVDVAGQSIAVTISLGISVAIQGAASIDALYPAADAALYRAKRAGRNRVEMAEALEDVAMPVLQPATVSAGASGFVH